MAYRIPPSMIRYLILTAVVFLLPLGLVPGTGLPNWLEAAIVLTWPAGLAAVVLRVTRMGTLVTADGITRRGFLGDRHYRWPDIRDFHLHDNGSVTWSNAVTVTNVTGAGVAEEPEVLEGWLALPDDVRNHLGSTPEEAVQMMRLAGDDSPIFAVKHVTLTRGEMVR